MQVALLHWCILTFGWFSINRCVIQSEILANVVDNIESHVADLVNDITTGSLQITKLCGMNTVKKCLDILHHLVNFFNYQLFFRISSNQTESTHVVLQLYG